MANTDGRMALDQQRLKDFRRQLGLSQEEMAFQCAEKRLSVSVASLKRAEGEKTILYRTARDIARFFDVELEQLVKNTSQNQTKLSDPQAANGELAKDAQAAIQTRRSVVLLHCFRHPEASLSCDEIAALIGPLLEEYSASIVYSEASYFVVGFGAEFIEGNDALRACYCGKRILSLVSENPVSLIATGHILSAENCLFEWDSAMFSTSSRLSQIVPKHLKTHSNIYIGEELHPLVSPHIQCSNSLQTQLNDSSEVSPALWQLQFDSPIARKSLALAGRKIELYQFKAVLDSSKSYSMAQVFCLNGVAGIGKTRLLEEFIEIAKAEEYACKIIPTLEFGDTQSDKILTRVTKHLLQLGDKNTHSDTAKTIDKWRNQRTSHEQMLLKAILNETLDADTQRTFEAMSHKAISQQSIELCASLTREVCDAQPLLLCFEDLHWANENTMDFLANWLPLVLDAPIVVACSYRPEAWITNAIQKVSMSVSMTSVNLLPLTNRDAEFLAKQLPANKNHQQLCIEKSQGNPLFLEQLLRSTFEVDQNLPFSIQALVGTKVNQLDDKNRFAVLAASVVGQQFSLPLLRYLIDDNDFEPSILIERFLVSGDGDAYTFNHALLCDGIYHTISENDLLSLHSKCAQWFCSRDVILELKHLFKISSPTIANKLFSVIDYLKDNYRFELALQFIESAENAKLKHLDLGELFYQQADILSKVGRNQEAVNALKKSTKYSQNSEEKARALILQSNCLNTLDMFEDAMSAIDEAEAIANENSMHYELSQIHYLRGNYLFPKGDTNACVANHSKALEFAKKVGNLEMEARALGGLGDTSYADGKMYSAYNYFLDCLSVCDEHDFKAVEASNLFMLGTVRIYQNQPDTALQDTYKGIEIASMVGHQRAEVVSRLTAGWILIDLLRLDEAQQQVEKALALADTIGAKRFIPFLQESLARIHWKNGNRDQAIDTITNALKQVDELQAHQFIGPWLLSTSALIDPTEKNIASKLTKGEALLNQGCVGHNYFRFYTQAIESCLQAGQWENVAEYARKLEAYTEQEKTPWSQFYIQRARALMEKHQGYENQSDLRQLIDRANKGGLKTAIALLEQALEGAPSKA